MVQNDLKILIAYSSIVYIGLVIIEFLTWYNRDN